MKSVIAYIGSVIDTTILVSIVSTQLVLADVSSFGLPVSTGVRLTTTVQDLLGLGPALLMLIGATYIVAFPVAHFAHKRFAGARVLWFAAAGLVSLPVALVLIKIMMGGTLLASARTPLGMALVSLCSMAGGVGYCWLESLLGRKRVANA